MKKLLIIAFTLFAFSAGSFAQVTASSSAGAEIIAPLTLTNTAGLHFGTVMRGTLAGTVQLSTAGIRTAGGGVTLSPIAPTLTVASFTIDGETGRTISISLPASTSIISGANNMLVDNFVSNPAAGNYVLAASTTTLLVGATLNVGANQASGSYAGTFDVTVNYQ